MLRCTPEHLEAVRADREREAAAWSHRENTHRVPSEVFRPGWRSRRRLRRTAIDYGTGRRPGWWAAFAQPATPAEAAASRNDKLTQH